MAGLATIRYSHHLRATRFKPNDKYRYLYKDDKVKVTWK